MTCPCSLSRFPWLRRLCSLVCVVVGCCSLPSKAQNLDKPLQSIDEEITAFAYAPDGRIVYSVYRKLKTKAYDLEHDDIWLQLTTTVVDDSGKTEDSFQTLLLDDSGHEIRINKRDNVILDAADAAWLPDNATIAYLSEFLKPHVLFSLKSTRIDIGPVKSPHDGRTFRDISPIPGTVSIVAVEQDRNLTGPSRLQRLDLFTDNDKELATKKPPISSTRKFSNSAISLPPLAWPASASASASSAGPPTNPASSSSAPSKKNPAI